MDELKQEEGVMMKALLGLLSVLAVLPINVAEAAGRPIHIKGGWAAASVCYDATNYYFTVNWDRLRVSGGEEQVYGWAPGSGIESMIRDDMWTQKGARSGTRVSAWPAYGYTYSSVDWYLLDGAKVVAQGILWSWDMRPCQ